MSDDAAAQAPELDIFEGGILGRTAPAPPLAALVAPAVGAEFNAIAAGLVPIACFRVDNIRFAFGSSFIEPAIKPDLARLGRLLRAHPPPSVAGAASPPRAGAPLSVFGHADPTGDDEFNKVLSGRRAQAVHALLVRDPESWNELYARPLGDDVWGVPAIERILVFLGRGGEPARDFDRDATKRKALFADYMKALAGDALPPLARGDFLGGGQDARGKADFQGCGEFNPILLFSQKDQTAFAAQKDKTARNDANVPNRRVMVLIFREGSRVDPAKWPCPRASEGSAGCRKRFWSDGERRRSLRLADAERTFETTKDTFACRFYHRLSDRSPCERVLRAFVFRVRLYTAFGKAIPNAPFTLAIAGRDPTPLDRADASGIVAVTLRDVVALSDCTLDWGFAPEAGQAPELLFSRKIFIVPDDDRSGEAALRKLHNLGYADADGAENVLGFQLDYGDLVEPALDPTGEMDERTTLLIHRVYEQAADELRSATL